MLYDLQIKVALPKELIDQFEGMDEVLIEAYIEGHILNVHVIDEETELTPPKSAEFEVQHAVEGRMPVRMKCKERCHL